MLDTGHAEGLGLAGVWGHDGLGTARVVVRQGFGDRQESGVSQGCRAEHPRSPASPGPRHRPPPLRLLPPAPLLPRARPAGTSGRRRRHGRGKRSDSGPCPRNRKRAALPGIRGGAAGGARPAPALSASSVLSLYRPSTSPPHSQPSPHPFPAPRTPRSPAPSTSIPSPIHIPVSNPMPMCISICLPSLHRVPHSPPGFPQAHTHFSLLFGRFSFTGYHLVVLHDDKPSLKHDLVFALFPLVLALTALSSPRFSPGGCPWEEASFGDGLAHTLPLLEALKLLTCLNLASKPGNAQKC